MHGNHVEVKEGIIMGTCDVCLDARQVNFRTTYRSSICKTSKALLSESVSADPLSMLDSSSVNESGGDFGKSCSDLPLSLSSVDIKTVDD